MSTTTIATVTTVVKVEELGKGRFNLTEIKSDPPPQMDLHSGNRKDLQFDLAFGIGIGGYYDFDDKEISVSATFGGSPIGSRYTAGLETGVSLGIDLWVCKGEIKIYKDGGKLRLGYTLGAAFVGDKSDNFEICNL